jgi:hypothetical protein
MECPSYGLTIGRVVFVRNANRLAVASSACQRPNEPGDAFCGTCSASLTETPLAPSPVQPASTVPTTFSMAATRSDSV